MIATSTDMKVATKKIPTIGVNCQLVVILNYSIAWFISNPLLLLLGPILSI
jgi:hypothetical protein